MALSASTPCSHIFAPSSYALYITAYVGGVFMRFSAIRINLRRVGAVGCCALLAALAVCLAAHSWLSAPAQAATALPANSPVSESGSATASHVISAGSSEDLGDVGSEYVSESDTYDGELSVPAYISLERITIDLTLNKPLDSARVSSLFGYRQNPVTGKYSFHSGYDLAAPHGSNIYAMYAGTVSTAAYDNGYGNYIILEHEGGFQTLYAHCSKLICCEGERVDAGQVIALVGSTGNSTGAHLHVEFRRNGQRYDPEWILGGIY